MERAWMLWSKAEQELKHWCALNISPATATEQSTTWAAEGKVSSMPVNLLTYTKQNVHLESYWSLQNILASSQRKEQTTE